jgi:two-component system chemotaxis response regulator CheY
MSYAVLIVDDSPTVRAVIRRSLGMMGLEVSEVHEAGNGLEALAVLSDHWVDIVFADLNMPEMNGVELVEKMSEDHILVSVPVVIVSSERNPNRIEELQRKGIRAYVKKPFKPEGLRDVIEEVLLKAAAGGEHA